MFRKMEIQNIQEERKRKKREKNKNKWDLENKPESLLFSAD